MKNIVNEGPFRMNGSHISIWFRYVDIIHDDEVMDINDINAVFSIRIICADGLVVWKFCVSAVMALAIYSRISILLYWSTTNILFNDHDNWIPHEKKTTMISWCLTKNQLYQEKENLVRKGLLWTHVFYFVLLFMVLRLDSHSCVMLWPKDEGGR